MYHYRLENKLGYKKKLHLMAVVAFSARAVLPLALGFQNEHGRIVACIVLFLAAGTRGSVDVRTGKVRS
jgi:hypothetical protein